MGNLSANEKIGSLDRRITIRNATQNQSESGAITETFADVATVWANVNSNGKSEKFVMERETTFNKKTFTIRYRNDFDEKSIVFFESKTYEILAINEVDDTRKRFLEILAERRE